MSKHFILITPYHRLGYHIGWHKLIETPADYRYIKNVLKKVTDEAGGLQIASHIISTNSDDVKSIIEKDAFFSDIVFFEDEDEFIDMYKNEKKLTANDVANYILSVGKNITNLKLQKLVYLCYENALKKWGVKLFDDSIFAYKLGPVIKSVYTQYSYFGRNTIEIEEDNSIYLPNKDILIKPSLSRILFSKDGINAMKSIDETLESYLHIPASDLVDITHEEGTAWKNVYIKGINDILITDQDILASN